MNLAEAAQKLIEETQRQVDMQQNNQYAIKLIGVSRKYRISDVSPEQSCI